MNISVLSELNRSGWKFEQAGRDEVKLKCPFHDDNTASCSVNTDSGLFKCHAAGCGASGDFITLFAGMTKSTRRVVLAEFEKRYGETQDQIKPVDPQLIEEWHKEIWNAPVLLGELRKRGVSDESIQRFRLGAFQHRITIPIYNADGLCVNVRKYLPGAPGADKMKNLTGHGKMRLYPIDQTKTFETIVICGGEVKAIAVAQRLNTHGIGAITATAGEGNWSNEFNEFIKGKTIYVCMDIDKAGKEAAKRLAIRLRNSAKAIYVVELPLDIDKHPTGDVNDYFGIEAKTAEDFIQLLKATNEWAPPELLNTPLEDPVEVHLAEAVKSKWTTKRIAFNAVVSAIDSSPYVIPRVVKCKCNKAEDNCYCCPVYAINTPEVLLEVPTESASILEMVNAPKKILREAVREALKIPVCAAVEFETRDYYNVEDCRLSPQLEIGSRAAEHILQPAFCLGHGLEANEQYRLVGKMFPHPKTQQTIMLVSEYEQTHDALSSYEPSEDELKQLEVFQPKEWTVESIDEKLQELYDDLSANVTRIYKRHELHLAMDLAFHSPLIIEFDGNVIKGWTEILIAGDSSQGKSEVASKMMAHYGLGERVECKNASVAGLLGGLQQMGNRWFVSWGVIPTHDKRLVVLEELKGTSTEVISHLTDMRSSGIAELPKIEKRRTHARTRLVCISNPRSDKPLSMFNFGIEAVKELIGGLEDIRRFDMVVLVSSTQVSAEELNKLQRYRPQVKHEHSAELCKRCVLFAWTREPNQIEFTEDASDRILYHSTTLCNEFTDVVPIIDRGSMRYKLGRLSAALAARTFSHKRFSSIIVQQCHVDYVAKFLRQSYSSSVFGYKDFSFAINMATTLLNPEEVKTRVLQVPFPKDFIDSLLQTNDIELRDICDWNGWDKGDAIQLLSFLVRRHALVREGGAYRKNSQFIELLKVLKCSQDMERMGRPDFIKEKF